MTGVDLYVGFMEKILDPWRWAVGQLLGSWQLFYCPEGISVVYKPHVEEK